MRTVPACLAPAALMALAALAALAALSGCAPSAAGAATPSATPPKASAELMAEIVSDFSLLTALAREACLLDDGVRLGRFREETDRLLDTVTAFPEAQSSTLTGAQAFLVEALRKGQHALVTCDDQTWLSASGSITQATHLVRIALAEAS